MLAVVFTLQINGYLLAALIALAVAVVAFLLASHPPFLTHSPVDMLIGVVLIIACLAGAVSAVVLAILWLIGK